MKSEIKIFESNLQDGIMCRNKKFYSDKLTQEEIDEIFKETRISLGKKYKFNGLKIIQPVQKTENNNVEYPDGKYVIINDNHLKKDDLWYERIETDIIIIEKKYKNIVIGNQCADCPIIIAEDRRRGVTALAHCGAAYIDRLLPKMVIESLEKSFNSKPSDIYVYISSFAKKDKFIYDTYPRWAKNKNVWDGCIDNIDSKYRIDMEKAILKQLAEKNIKNIKINEIDTITNPNYASHYCEIRGNKAKQGQNFVGFFYK